MIRYLAILLTLAFAASWVCAQQTTIPSKPELTVSLEPRHVKTGDAYVQGQIVLRVQLVSPHPFEALNLQLPPIPGARTLTLSPPKTDEIHNYGFKGYVYETKLALFPEQSGRLTIPAIAAAGTVAVGPGKKESFTEAQPERQLTVKPIDPSYNAPWWLVADEATMREVWVPAPEELRVGDIARRNVIVTVYGVTAEHLPAIEQPTNEGYTIVGSATKANTDLTPDGAVATVRQFWDLRIDAEEVMSIRPIQLVFWNPATGVMASANLPAKRIEPLPRDVAARQAKLLNDARIAHRNRRIGLFAALSIPALGLLILMLATLYQSLPTRADRQLSQTCKASTTPAACLRAVTRWSRDSFGVDERITIRHLQQTLGGEAAERLDALQRALFAASDTTTEPVRLAQSLLSAARRQRRHAFWRQIMRGITSIVSPPSHLLERIR